MRLKRIIIFDFNRTLFDPSKERLIPGARIVLAELQKRNYFLYLLSQNRDGKRLNQIKKLHILTFFKKTHIVPQKTLACFGKILPSNIDKQNSFVVGDYIKQEILFGNTLGLKTIWIQDNVLPENVPTSKEEQPVYTIKSIFEILEIVR